MRILIPVREKLKNPKDNPAPKKRIKAAVSEVKFRIEFGASFPEYMAVMNDTRFPLTEYEFFTNVEFIRTHGHYHIDKTGRDLLAFDDSGVSIPTVIIAFEITGQEPNLFSFFVESKTKRVQVSGKRFRKLLAANIPDSHFSCYGEKR